MATVIDEKIPNMQTSWDGYKKSRVEEFIKEQLTNLISTTDEKVGWITYENGAIVFYDSEGGQQLGSVPLSGTVYAITLASTTPSSFYVLKDETTAYVDVSPSTKAGTLGGEMEDFPEDYTWSLLVDNGGGSFVERASGTCLSGGTIYQNVRPYLAIGANRVKITVQGVDSGQSKSTTFTANVTSLTLTSKFNWNVPFIQGQEYAINGLYFSGNLQKTLWVRVDDDDEQTYTQVFASGSNYITTPYSFNMTDKFPGETGIHTVEIWISGDGVETPHFKYNIMCVESGDVNQVSLVCINEALDTAVNYSTQGLFRYATYNATEVTINITANDGTQTFVIAEDETETVTSQTKQTYTTSLELDSEATTGFSMHIELEVDSNVAELDLPIDNSNSYAATEGAVFYMNAATRSNGSGDREDILNIAPDAVVGTYDAVWENMSWSTDGWYQDSDANRALVIKAGSSCTITDLKPLTRSATGDVSVEMKFRVSDIADYDTPIISMMSDATYDDDTTNGVIVFPTRITVLSSTDRQITPQTVQLNEDKVLHMVVVFQRLYKSTGRNLCRIYINGIQQAVFEYSGEGSFGAGSLVIGQESADVCLYSMRVYNKVLEADAVLQNFLNSIIDGLDYTRSGVRHDNNILDGGQISYDLCKAAGFNTMVIKMANDTDIPSLTHSTGGNSTVWFEYADHPTWNTWIENAPIDGQGTTSMRYYRWNLRWKLKSAAIFHYADGTTDSGSGYIAGKGLHPKVSRIVAKKNVASSMQGHKMGACNMYDELFEACGLKSSLPNSNVRVSIYQYPFFGFQKFEDGTYEFIGLYTSGPDKNDAGTRGYDYETYPNLLCVEGPNHAPLGTRFLHPWVDAVYDYTEETLKFGGEEAWDVDACRFKTDKAEDAANILALLEQEWKPAYEIVYFCSPYLRSLTDVGKTLAQLNADPATWRAASDVLGNRKNEVLQLYDSSYNLIYYRTSTGQYEVLSSHDMLDYLEDYLGGVSSPTTAQLLAARMAKFKAEGPNYWSINGACYHEAFCELIACSDNHAKNTYPMKWQTLAQGGRWIWCQDDMDTILMTDNNGQQTKSPSVEVGDVTQDGVDIFQGSSSAFWAIITSQDGYYNGVKDMLNTMVEQLVSLAVAKNIAGANIHQSVINMFNYYFWNDSAEYFPCTAYNSDGDWSYVDVWELDPTAVYNNVPPLRQANGTQLNAEKQWTEHHLVALFSKYGIGAFTGAGDDGYGRLEFTPASAFNFALKPAIEMYPTGNSGGGTNVRGSRTPAGTACTVQATSDGTTTFYIKGVDWYTDLGDLCGLQLTTRGGDSTVGATMSIAGKRLRRVKVGDSDARDVRFNAGTLNIAGNAIETVDCRNVTTLRNAVSLSRCPRLRSVYFGGSSAPSIMLPVGSKVEEVEFSDQLITLFMHTLPMLEMENITLNASARASMTGLYINNCAQINPIEMLRIVMNTANNNLHYVTLMWEGAIEMTGAEMELLVNLAQAYDPDTGTGYGRLIYDPENEIISNSDAHALLQGTINVTTPMYQDTADTLRAFFGNSLTINCETYYVRFEDPAVMNICATNWGDWHWEYQPNDGGTGGYNIVATAVAGTGGWDLVDGNYVENKNGTGGYNITETAASGAGAYDKVKVGDGITEAQCAAVSSIGNQFKVSGITSFDEFEKFTGITAFGNIFSGGSLQRFKYPARLTRVQQGSLNASSLNMDELVLPVTVTSMEGPNPNGYIGCITIQSYLTVIVGFCYGSSIKGNSAGTVKITYTDGVLPISTSGSVGQYYQRHYYYVPDALLAEYKAATGWSNIQARIFALSEYPTV